MCPDLCLQVALSHCCHMLSFMRLCPPGVWPYCPLSIGFWLETKETINGRSKNPLNVFKFKENKFRSWGFWKRLALRVVFNLGVSKCSTLSLKETLGFFDPTRPKWSFWSRSCPTTKQGHFGSLHFHHIRPWESLKSPWIWCASWVWDPASLRE